MTTRRDGRLTERWRAGPADISSCSFPRNLFANVEDTSSPSVAPGHHLMIGTWTPPGVIITVAFDDETLKLELVKKTEIPEDEPISWMAFDVCAQLPNIDATNNG